MQFVQPTRAIIPSDQNTTDIILAIWYMMQWWRTQWHIKFIHTTTDQVTIDRQMGAIYKHC